MVAQISWSSSRVSALRCPIYRPPEGINGLIVLDDETRAWLENNALDIWVVRDGTRKKKSALPNHLQHISGGYALDNYNGTISNVDRNITNLRFADGIDGITGEDDELTVVHNLDTAAAKFSM